MQAETKVLIETSMGNIIIRLYDETPKHRDNFIKLVESGYYNDLLFHRVIKDFMIQGGDPDSKGASAGQQLGAGGPGYTIPAEFIYPKYFHKRGALSAARQSDQVNPMKESSGSQFYIVHDENACLHLDGQYTIFGEVIDGLDVIDKIAAVDVDRYDRPYEDVIILSITQLGLPEESKEEVADTTKAE